MTPDVLYALWRRDVVKFLRDRQSLAGVLARPPLWLLAFGFGLRGSFRGAGSTDYVTFLVPGLAAMTAGRGLRARGRGRRARRPSTRGGGAIRPCPCTSEVLSCTCSTP